MNALAEDARVLAGVLVDRLEEIVDAEFSLLKADPGPLAALIEIPEAVEPTLEITRRSLRHELEALAAGFEAPQECPQITAELARQAAMAGAPVDVVQRGFRAGHVAIQGVAEKAIGTLDLPQARRAALEKAASGFFFAYANRNVEFAATEYARERAQLRGSASIALLGRVREVLDGAIPDPGELEYALDRNHIAVIAWGAEADAAIRSLAQAVDREALAVPSVGETTWAWLGSSGEPTESEARALKGFRPPTGAAMSLGEPAGGLEGFRRSHLQARLAQRVGLRTSEPFTPYRAAAIESLALGGEESIESFVSAELDPVDRAGDGPRLPLRATLRAYFAAGQNATAAAASLGVSERTIAYRLRKLETELGCPVNSRRAELDAALRLERLRGREPQARLRL